MLPKEVFVEVIGTAKIIDETYGSERDVFENDGGYICIVENDSDVTELNSKYEIDLAKTEPEYCTKLSNDWLNVLIICNNEFAITVLLSTQTTVSERLCDNTSPTSVLAELNKENVVQKNSIKPTLKILC